eukprot:scaffold307872_cov27-Tisochrysis_lutea.AAC.3
MEFPSVDRRPLAHAGRPLLSPLLRSPSTKCSAQEVRRGKLSFKLASAGPMRQGREKWQSFLRRGDRARDRIVSASSRAVQCPMPMRAKEPIFRGAPLSMKEQIQASYRRENSTHIHPPAWR